MSNLTKNLTEGDMIIYVIDPSMVDISSYPTIMFCYRIASIPLLVFNLFGLYLIYVATPRSLGNYRWHLFALQAYQTILEIGSAWFVMPLIALPAKSFVAEGLLTDIGIRPSCQLLAIAFVLVGSVSSLECILFIRQQSVLPAGHLFKFRDQRLGIGIAAHHSFQFLLTGALEMIVLQNDDLRSLQELKEDFPRLYPFFIQRGSYAIGNTAGAQAVAVLGGLCLFYILYFYFLLITTLVTVKQQEQLMSTKTLMMQKRWLRHIYVQVAIILIHLIFPVFWFFTLFIFQLEALAAYCIWPILLVATQSTVCTCSNFFYSCYKEYTLQLFRQYVLKEEKRSHAIRPSSLPSQMPLPSHVPE